MLHLSPNDYPKDFYYHRTSSEIYRPYLESCWPISIVDIPNSPQYAWKKNLFGGICVSRFERTDFEPNIEMLKKGGTKHGMVTWIPYSRTEIPAWWRKLWFTDHFQETGMTELVPEYKKKWSERARRALKKFEKSWAEVRSVDAESFMNAFRKTRVKHWFKSDYISNYKRIRAFAPDKVRQWMVFLDGEPVAGLGVIDYIGNHSVHFVAFTSKKAYDIQWGTGLIDAWFQDSIEKNIKYITFDQLRNQHGPRDQKGYTEFKENFIDYRLSFRNAYFKVF